jgi:hypothetical protein
VAQLNLVLGPIRAFLPWTTKAREDYYLDLAAGKIDAGKQPPPQLMGEVLA